MLHAFYQKTQKHSLKYHLVRAEPPFTVKTIDWVHHTGPEHSILLSVTYVFCVSQVCHGVGRCVKKWKLFFVKPGMKVNGQY